MKRFPPRTLVLMLLSLAAFFFMWWRTHGLAASRTATPAKSQVIVTFQLVSDAGQ
jgi:hypothetical protein